MTVVISLYLLTILLNILYFLSSHIDRTGKLIPFLAVELYIASCFTSSPTSE